MTRFAGTAGLVLVGLLASCARAETFATFPGFDDWFDRNPPTAALPTESERALLHRYRPIFFVPTGAPGPIDFYADYIGSGRLIVDEKIHERVTPSRLSTHVHDPEAVFEHEPGDRRPEPVAYGRVDREALPPVGEITFLTWHFVFRYSGLPAELPGWQELLAGLLGDRDDWHQLDHYTAATLALAPGERPLALILQHHNHLRSYWFGEDLELPADGRARIAAAVRSNELYPRPDTTAHERVVRFLEADNVVWLATGAAENPWTAAHDRIEPGRHRAYRLAFLPQTDPFYRFHGRLGEERMLPGRDGPPGADYKTWPAFMSRVLQMCAFRWPADADPDDVADLRRLLADPADEEARRRLFDDCRAFVRARL
ncbi:MAG: hypothetical protein U5K33_08035 [Halofilum sp. (in: g-proteobacteria)]|nr:hypothetical protein [Halofilum sp. (in: g-proteobacteria)]